ncbi:HigA family addiction module antitoxin [Rahnella contaminans]|uniref:HigA family addiction module antitoxin n=1 Tax=Rahnella contaminans TaxID=2703882 RepID=UPI0023DA4DBB|nr:HigA family addiction module antitoxin [Rahnella contaminans]
MGEILTKEFLKQLNMSREELAESMGICKQDIEDIICGRRRLMTDEGRILAEMFGTAEGFWINLQALQDRKEQRSK